MWRVHRCLLSVATLTPPPGIFSESVWGIELETVSMASLGPCAGLLLQTWNCLQRV